MPKSKSRKLKSQKQAGNSVTPDSQMPTKATHYPEKIYPIRLASPLIRLYAAIIDGIALTTLFIVLAVTTKGAFLSASSAWADLFVFFGYFVLFTGIKGQTPGKWTAGIIVVDRDGRVPGVGVAIPREMVGRFVSTVSFGLGLLWLLFDTNRQGWHDKIAGTFVVIKTEPGAPAPFKALWKLRERGRED